MTAKTLMRFATTLGLPVDVVTQKLAFLGRTGSGKTYAATKLAELMLDHGAQIVALDPVGKWYGLRVAGAGPGFDIPVVGGLFGDLPLEPTAGALIADVIVDRGISVVLDVSQFETDAQKARFSTDFADRFFFRKKAAPSAVHVFLEECQEFVPQNPSAGEQLMLHHWTRMAKLGRNFGIGMSLISQRPQEVNKKVLNMTEGLFAFQMRGPQERKTIKEWSNDKDLNVDIVAELPSLPQGTAFASSPQWLGVEQRIDIAKKRTADVSATPTVGSTATPAKPLTPIDLEQLRTTMAATIERAKAEDPAELRKEIAQLKRELTAKGKASTDPAIMEQHVDAAVTAALQAEWKRLRGALSTLDAIQSALGTLHNPLADVNKKLGISRDDLQAVIEDLKAEPRPVAPARAGGRHEVTRQRRELAVPIPQPSTPRAVVKDVGRRGGELRILDAIAELNALGVQETSRAQIGVMAGYNLSGGTPAQYVGKLVDLELIAIPRQGYLELTVNGKAKTRHVTAPTSIDELHRRVFARLSPGEAKILEALLQYYPDAVSRAALGAQTGYNLSGGTPAQYVGKLVTLDFVTIPRPGELRASDLLFPEGLR